MSAYESAFVANKIKELLKARKISASKMLIDCNMNKNALYTMQSAGYLPRLEAVAQIADYLDCSVDYLLGRTDVPELPQSAAGECSGRFSAPENNQVKTGKTPPARSDKAGDRPVAAAQPEEVVYYVISGFYQPMSAGSGTEAGDGEPEDFVLTKRPPRGASYVAPVSGDSMEPTFHDGDRLFVQTCDQIEPGRIGVFLMDGRQWVKELGDGVLVSHNPKYAPIPMTEDIRCQGLVLGVCDPTYFP